MFSRSAHSRNRSSLNLSTHAGLLLRRAIPGFPAAFLGSWLVERFVFRGWLDGKFDDMLYTDFALSLLRLAVFALPAYEFHLYKQ